MNLYDLTDPNSTNQNQGNKWEEDDKPLEPTAMNTIEETVGAGKRAAGHISLGPEFTTITVEALVLHLEPPSIVAPQLPAVRPRRNPPPLTNQAWQERFGSLGPQQSPSYTIQQ